MRQTRTRILSLLLALVMCLGLLPVTAMAAGGNSGEPALFLDPNHLGAQRHLHAYTTAYYQTVPPLDITGPQGESCEDLQLTGNSITISYPNQSNKCILRVEISSPSGNYTASGQYPRGTTVKFRDPGGDAVAVYQFVSGTGSAKVDPEDFTLTEDTTVYVSISVSSKKISVTLDYNGAGETKSSQVDLGSTFELPTPSLSGYRFLGWYCGTVNGQYLTDYHQISSGFEVRGNWLLHAMWEKEAASTYTITFDPNGGTVNPTSKQTGADGRVPDGYPTPTREGYTFLGWFTDGDGYKPAETEIWGGNQTLVARWEKAAETVRINFLPNGGRITEFKGKTVPAPNNGYPFTVDDVTGVDMHSGIGWTNTEASGLLASLPTVEREGYAFDGWYITGTGPESNLAWDGKLTDFSKLEKYTSDRKFTIGVELAAKWVVAEGYTVTFNLNGKSGTAPKAQTVEAGKTVELPDAYANGFRLMGWGYTEDGTTLKEWKATDTVKSNLTLYALWDYDRFNFGNNYGSFDPSKSKTYLISGKYLEALQSGLESDQWAEVKSLMDSKWKGSCFGMSALYCLRYAGRIDPAKFQSGAAVLHDFTAPVSSSEVWSLINYYFLQQRRPESDGFTSSDIYQMYEDHKTSGRNNARYYFPNLVENGTYSRCLVEDLTNSKLPSVICFDFDDDGERPGHAVVGLDCTKTASGYSISIWDPNNNQKNDTLIISSDFRTATFSSNTYKNVAIYGSLPTKDVTSTFEHLNIQNYTGSGAAQTVAGTTNMTSLETSLDSFTVTVADGTYAEIKNGDVVGGTLQMALGVTLAATGGNSGHSYALPSSSSYTVKTAADSKGTIALHIPGYYVDLDSEGIKELRVTNDGQVSVSSDKAAGQTLSVISDQLGDTWNSLTVTGIDTGFTVDVSKETVKIASENNVSISVMGRNVFSDAKSGTQTVTASSSGTAVAMSTLGTTSTQQPSQPTGTNPFTDVKAGAYYYDAVLWAVEQKVTSGTSATTFSPDASCTRGQIVTFLWRAAGSPKPSSNNNPFTDVKSGAYYYDAVLWAVEKGITSGTSATTFSPDTSCTRGQTVTFLYRAAESPKAASSTNPFTDVKSGAYYYDAVLWAVEQKITSGTSATTFAPDATVTRGQTVTFLYRSQG